MTEILKSAVERGASDIFVVAGLPLTYKVRGEQQRETADGAFTPEKTAKHSQRKSIVLPRGSRTA